MSDVSRSKVRSPLLCSCRALQLHIAQELCRGFRQDSVDEHSRTQFKSSYTSQPGNDAQVRVEIFNAGIFSGRRADGVIEVRILQADVKLPKNSSQHPRQIAYLRRIDITKARHVAPLIYRSAERRG